MSVRNELTYLEEVIQRRNERIEELENKCGRLVGDLIQIRNVAAMPPKDNLILTLAEDALREVSSDE